jgi:hypothetical protein
LFDCHPQKQDNNAYLLVSVYQNGDSFRKMTEHGLYVEIKKIARKACITKNVFPHLMRHSRASILAENLTDQQMKAYLGWSKNSQMCSVYVHDPQEENKQDLLKVVKCQRCKEYNPTINLHCFKCGYPLSENELAKEKAEESRLREADKHEMEKHVESMVEQLLAEKLKEKMKAFDSLLDEAESKVDAKKLKELTKDEVDW